VRVRRHTARKPELVFLGILVCASIVSTSIAGGSPAAAVTRKTEVTSPLGSIQMTLESPQQFIEAKCLFIPLDIAWSRRSDVTIIGELTVRKTGSSVSNPDSFILARSEPTTGKYTDYVYVCPADGPGAFVLTGTITFIASDSSDVVEVPAITFMVTPAKTSITQLTLSRSGSVIVVSGRAVVEGEDKDLAAGGILVIAAREAGALAWVNVAVPPVGRTGGFSAKIEPPLTAGTWVRAQVLKCKWCTGARAYGRVR
jgi:hypothetical protein